MIKMGNYLKIDLHMHSIKSDDGEYTPEHLMKLCHNAGLEVVAIADHNSVEAVSDAKIAASALGLTLIPAIELDCVIEDVELHVLGYGINEADVAFARVSASLLKQEQAAAGTRLQLARDLGLYLDEEKAYELSHDGCITGEIIAEVALMDERNHAFLKDYLPGGVRSDNPFVNFYWDYCSQGKPAYVKINYMSLKEAVELIQQAGGIAILAHPGNNTKENMELLDKIFAYDVVGLEAYSSYHTPEQIEFYRNYAKEHHLCITAGSDFHGKTKPSIHLGEMECVEPQEVYQSKVLHIGI